MIRAVRARVGMLAGAAILASMVCWQGGAVLEGLRRIDGPTLLAAIGLGLFTTVFSAWRWCLVARGLKIRIPLVRAVADYYRALFLNAALPGGVLGDVHRAVRHGRSAGDVGRGVRAVVLERTAGQVVLLAVGVTLLITQPSLPLAETGHLVATPGAAGALAVAGGLAIVCAVRLRGKPGTSRWHRAVRATLAEARLGLLARGTWPGVLIASVAVLAGHLALFLLAARAAGSTEPTAELLPLMVLALLAMALPLNIGGWGPREGVTAWAFGTAGLGAAQGLTVAVVYGLLAFAASLPGIGVLVTQWFTGVRRPQVEFEESVLAKGGASRRRTERVPHQLRTGETEPRDAVAEQDRCHGDIEPVQRPRVEEARHGDAAALDQHAPQAASRELPHQASRGERGAVGQGQYVNAAGVRSGLPALAAGAHHPQGRCCSVGEHPAPQRHSAVRIEDDAHRVGPRTGADRQLGIVRNGGAGPDDHRVGERAQAVQVLAVLLAGDVVGVARTARDETVQALPQLCEREAGAGQAQRQIAVGEGLRLGRSVSPLASAVRAPEQPDGLGVRLGSDAAQPLPGCRCVEHADTVPCGTAVHRAPRRISAGCRVSAVADGRGRDSAPADGPSGARSEKYSANESTRPANNSLPFAGEAIEGQPTTPDSV